jgi:hypothetical protein
MLVRRRTSSVSTDHHIQLVGGLGTKTGSSPAAFSIPLFMHGHHVPQALVSSTFPPFNHPLKGLVAPPKDTTAVIRSRPRQHVSSNYCTVGPSSSHDDGTPMMAHQARHLADAAAWGFGPCCNPLASLLNLISPTSLRPTLVENVLCRSPPRLVGPQCGERFGEHILRCDKANRENTRDSLREAAVVGWSRPKSTIDVVHGVPRPAAGHLEPKKATVVVLMWAVVDTMDSKRMMLWTSSDVFPIRLRAHVLHKLPLAPYSYRLRKSTLKILPLIF